MDNHRPEIREIIHFDMDAFYASVEVLDNPELANKPVIVGGTSNRGVVSAASYQAREFGIHSAMPIFTARKLCPNGVFLPVRMSRYKDISDQIMAIFLEITPLVEPISLDEAFLDVASSASLFGSANHIAISIKKRIQNDLKLTVSAGIASSKMVAKIASDLQKPNGLTIVPAGEEQEFLKPLAIKRLWGVGKTTQKTLSLMGVQTIGDLCNLSLDLLSLKFGKHGEHLYKSARGIDERQVEPLQQIKSVGNEETYERDIIDQKTLRKEILALAGQVGKRLRRYGLSGKTITLKVKYNDFLQITRSATLPIPTDAQQIIYNQATQLLSKTEAGKKPIRLLGISLSNLKKEATAEQLHLFSKDNTERQSSLNRALDNIQNKFGSKAMRPAVLIEEDDWEE